MPLPNLIVSLFPSVPQLPGVPQLARSLLFPPPVGPGIEMNAPPQALWRPTKTNPVWGVFDQNGNKVIDSDAVLDFDNRNEWRISNYPVQQGQFSSFNRVKVPFENSIRMRKTGSLDDRIAFLAQVNAVAATTALYIIITPEATYLNCSLTRFEVPRRQEAGAFILNVDLFFEEIVSINAQYSATQTLATPTQNALTLAAIPASNAGNVQPQVPTGPTVTAARQLIAGPPP